MDMRKPSKLAIRHPHSCLFSYVMECCATKSIQISHKEMLAKS
jgi:hypothetical protein